MAKKKEAFDWRGLLKAHNEINKHHIVPLPKFSVCTVCLGANTPGQKEYPKGVWCCGAYCDGFAGYSCQPFGFCKRFKLDNVALKLLVGKCRPKDNETQLMDV